MKVINHCNSQAINLTARHNNEDGNGAEINLKDKILNLIKTQLGYSYILIDLNEKDSVQASSVLKTANPDKHKQTTFDYNSGKSNS